jgi:alpha-D-ribose 1-methylphosphonate 5-triphosphate synthase subunit PhnL
MAAMIKLEAVAKTFTLHNEGGTRIPVMTDVGFAVAPGECQALVGPSGVGKSTLMRMIYGNYLADRGTITVGQATVTGASARDIVALRRHTLGYVSQFLRVVPRVPTTEVVAEPLRHLGVDAAEAHEQACALLERLHVPPRLWSLSPTTFSGGEQQRVNIARSFIHPYPALLLDEPTASLDARNREVVLELITAARQRGAAMLGIFHDQAAREAVCTGAIDLADFAGAA